MKLLWTLFIAGQIISAGNMNYQQEMGYYEINPIYGKHPAETRIYLTKAIEIGAIYALTKITPDKYDKPILIGANAICWGFIIRDNMHGVSLTLRW